MTSPVIREFLGHGPDTYSTPETWYVDGVPLNTYAMAVRTRGGDRMGVPTLRGSNYPIPGRAGQQWTPKTPDSRTINLEMWVTGATASGQVYDRVAFDRNWRALQRLIWRPGQTFPVAKRIRLPDGESIVVTAQAEFAGGLTPSMTGDARAEFEVTLNLPDPFFYAAPVLSSAILDDNRICNVRNRGDYLAHLTVYVPSDVTPSRWLGVPDDDPASTALHLAAGHLQLVTAPAGPNALLSGVWLKPAVYGDGAHGWAIIETEGWSASTRLVPVSVTPPVVGPLPTDSVNPSAVFAGRMTTSPSTGLIEIPRDVDTRNQAGTRVILTGSPTAGPRFAVVLRERFL